MEIKFKSSKKSLGLVFLLLTISNIISCSKAGDKELYGKEFNNRRIELDVPIIEEHWMNLNKHDSIYYWTNKSGFVEKREPHHLYKDVILSKGRVRVERDAFNYICDEDTVRSLRLIVTTVFDNETEVEQRFSLIYFLRDSFPPTINKEISKYESDSLLLYWKLR